MKAKHLCDFIEEATRATSMASRCLRPEGAPMSDRAMAQTLQESVDRLNDIVKEMVDGKE